MWDAPQLKPLTLRHFQHLTFAMNLVKKTYNTLKYTLQIQGFSTPNAANTGDKYEAPKARSIWHPVLCLVKFFIGRLLYSTLQMPIGLCFAHLTPLL